MVSDTPRRLHPVTPVVDVLALSRQLALPFVLALVGGGGDLGLAFVILGAVVLLVVARYIRWWRFTYVVDAGVLRIDEGVLTRKRREVPVERIQQVDVVAKLRHRAVGVVALHVDAAGGGGRGADVKLEVVSHQEAARLRGLLVGAVGDHASSAGPAETTTPARGAAPAPMAGRPVVQVSVGELALAGITGAQLLVMLGIVASATRLLDDVPDTIVDDVLEALPRGAAAAVAVAVVGVPLWLALAAGAAVFSDYGFALTTTGREVHVRRGLLDQREATVALHRVQAVRIQQTFLRRLVGRVAIAVQSAGAGGGQQSDVSRVTIPLVRVRDAERVVAELLPGATPLPALVPAPPAARRRSIVRHVVPATAAAAVVALATWPWGALSLVLIAVAWFAGELAHRGLGHAATATHLVARSGSLVRETVIVPVAKAQSARLRSTPFQRRVGLATLAVDVAGKGSTRRAYDADAERLAGLHERVLASSTAVADELAARRRTRGAV